MSDEAKCCECGRTVSHETGFTMSGTLAEGSPTHIHCPDCTPNQSKGYTIADLQQMCEDGKVELARYQMDQMEQLGPDAYFFVAGPPPNAEGIEDALGDE
ncbi:hypothetical protein [Mycobacterium sp. TY815]|uniref:hypothetical protein n=1 Tax=Mycobacterium sp. TY815 TaxID=3050581 RepID=UPI002741DCC1|nr:hypothetical protein [Mycobacterium sp. TY815]MDP7706816.1 hypothetical protein [Mycobacterium sp. TY815]